MPVRNGFPPQQAAGVYSPIGITALFGRIGYGRVADRLGGLRSYWLASAVQTALVFWYTQMGSLAGLYTLSILYSLGYSGVMTCLVIAARELAPVLVRGTVLAVVALFGWVGMGLAGYQGGFFFNPTGSYTLSFANAAFARVINLLIVGAVIFPFTRRQAAGKTGSLACPPANGAADPRCMERGRRPAPGPFHPALFPLGRLPAP